MKHVQWCSKCLWQIGTLETSAVSFRGNHSQDPNNFGANLCYPLKTVILWGKFLCRNWALAETECLTMSHHFIMQHKLPIKNWMLSVQAIKLGIHGSIPSLNGSGINEIRLKQVLKAQISCISKWHRCRWSMFL